MQMLDDLEVWHVRQKMKSLLRKWEHLPPDYPEIDAPAPVQRPRPYSRLHPIVSNFATMHLREDVRQQWRILVHPKIQPCAANGPYFYVHLYSGRRRQGDFHYWMQHYLEHEHPALCSCVCIISIDTAIAESMNIHNQALWQSLLTIASSGRLLGIVLGPPCETWSSARFHVSAEPPGYREPRPLRLNFAVIYGDYPYVP